MRFSSRVLGTGKTEKGFSSLDHKAGTGKMRDYHTLTPPMCGSSHIPTCVKVQSLVGRLGKGARPELVVEGILEDEIRDRKIFI